MKVKRLYKNAKAQLDNCRWTRSWWSVLSVLRQSVKRNKKTRDKEITKEKLVA